MRQRNQNFIVLLEIVIVVLFFSLTATVVLRVFTGAHAISARAQALEDANYAVQSLAEQLNGQKEPEKYLTSVGFAPDAEGELTKTDQSLEISVQLRPEQTKAGTLWTAEIRARRKDDQVEIPVSWYLAEEAS